MFKKTVFITGSSSGIGKSLAIESAKRGFDLALMARNLEALSETARECEELGAKVFVCRGDVSLKSDCKRFIEGGIDALGRLDILINNAGISMRGLFKDTDSDVLEKLMNTNFWGTVYCTEFAMNQLLKNQGSVVGVSSIAGFKGLPARTGYSASKFAMQGFLESLRCENLHTGVHVLIACPGYTASNIRKSALDANGKTQDESPLNEKNLMSPDLVAIHILDAIAKKRLYLILTLQGKLAVWINKLFPRLADRLTYNVIAKEPNSPFK